MLNNDVLRRIRYILNYNDVKMLTVFKLADLEVSPEKLSIWLKKDDDPLFEKLADKELASFLNGLITDKRGKKEGGQPLVESKLTNNLIFRKLIIAFALKSEEVLEVLALADFKIGKHELSAFFRKAGHKNYRECKAQVLRNFLNGLQSKLRPS